MSFLLSFSNAMTSLVGLGGIGIGVYLTIVSPPDRGFLDDVPSPLNILILALGGFMFLVSALGFRGASKKSRCLLNIYALLTVVSLLVTIGAFTYILLYVNMISTVDAIDNGFTSLALSVQSIFADYMEADGPTWIKLQDSLSCCGLSLSHVYYDPLDYAETLTGGRCLVGIGPINNILNQVPVAGVGVEGAPLEAIQLQLADPIIAPSEGFFCVDTIGNTIRSSSTTIGVTGGVLVVLQVLNIRSAMKSQSPTDQAWVDGYAY